MLAEAASTFGKITNHSRVLVLSERTAPLEPYCTMLARLTEFERAHVLDLCSPVTVKRGRLVFQHGRKQVGIFIIMSGAVRVFFVSLAGREITRAYWFPGNFIGGPDVFARAPNMWSAVATRDTNLLFLRSDHLEALCRRFPNLALGVIDALVFKGRCYAAMAQMLGTRSVGERLTKLLIHLADLYGIEEERGVKLDLGMSQEDLAHMIGGARQSVTIGFRRLSARGLVMVDRNRITIPDLAQLRKLVP